MKPQRPAVFVIVPAFNEANAIGAVIHGLLRDDRTVVVVDDGSTDDTWRRLDGLPVHRIRHAINRGQGAALQTGIDWALRHRADIIVTFDSDGQHDADDIDRIIAPIAAGECDLALGSRFLGRAIDIPAGRRILLRLGVVFTRAVSRIRVTDVHNGLRAFSRRAASGLVISMDRMAHASEILDQIAAHDWTFREVPVTVRYSDYSVAKGQRSSNAIRIALQMIAGKLR
ncbi:MAG: glycosyltransferase family 2 protein [Gemmatimonadota bacterium]